MEVTMDKKEKKSLPEPRTYTVEQIAAMLNIGRTTAYQLVKQEEFRIVRIGNAIRVSKKSFDEWLESLDLWILQEKSIYKLQQIYKFGCHAKALYGTISH